MARTVLSDEAQITERLEGKARQQVLLLGQWYAISQAVLAVALGSDVVGHRWLLWVAAGLGLTAGVAAAITVVDSWRVWRLRDLADVTPQGLLQMRDQAHKPNEAVLDQLVEHHAFLLQTRRESNRKKADAFAKAERMWAVAMALPLFELGFAMAAILIR